jgi:CRP-like cAMP-binding protein
VPFQVVAAGAVTTTVVPTQRLLAALRSSPAKALCCALAIDDIAAVCERALVFTTSSLRARIADVLLRASERDEAGAVLAPFTHREIAAELGSPRQSVSRVLKGLERDGIIRCRYGGVVVLDVRALRGLLPT